MNAMTKISFEFFPPNTPEGLTRLTQVAKDLEAAVHPEYFSVTYGAGGSTQDKTLAAVRMLINNGHKVVPHVSCLGASEATIRQLLDGYLALGCDRIVALRGDLPSGMLQGGQFRYAADLVQFVRLHYGKQFVIEVAAYPEVHPQSNNAGTDFAAFCAKLKAGSDSAITQLFYNADAYFDFVQRVRAAGFDTPIVPGIMPIHNFSKIRRFADGCGAELPRWLIKQMEVLGDDETAVQALGTKVMVSMCQRLVDAGAPALHFYTLNKAELSLGILERVVLHK